MSDLYDLVRELGVDPPPPGYVTKISRRKYSPHRRTLLQKFFIKDPFKFKDSDPDELISHVKFMFTDIVGPMNSGKTTLSLTFSYAVERFYSRKICNENECRGPYNVVTIVAPSLPIAVSKVPDGSEIINLVVDDAPILQFAAKREKEDVYLVGIFFLIRHIVLQKSRSAKYVVVMFNTQRYKSLDIVFRSAPLVIFKALLGTKEELLEMRRELGADLFRALMDITRGIYIEDDEFYYRFYVYRTLWLERSVVELEKTAKPSNLIVAKEEREETIRSLLEGKLLHDPKKMVKSIVIALAKEGKSWAFIQEHVLPFFRKTLGWKLPRQKSLFDLWKKHYKVL